MTKKIFLFACIQFFILSTYSQEKKSEKWNVANPTGTWNFKEMSLSTDEGTWMNLDVSPDGKLVTFDLLGDIYKMPIEGGEATLLRQGLPFEIQPRFSPDGSKILFTSDAGGGDNLWMMNIDGSNPKQITKETFRLLNNGVWSSDGNYVYGRKHYSSQRSLGAGEIWMYHKTGGTGTQLTKRKNDQQDVNEPSISPDGRYLYYSEDVAPGGMFEYNRDPNKQIYVIKRFDLKNGTTTTITGGPGGAARPEISRDGKKLAFVRRVRTKTVLFIHDLETGEEWPIDDTLSKDQQTAWAIFGVYPGFGWMPNNEEVVYWSQGKIHKTNIHTTEGVNIPFQVNSKIKIAETIEFDTPVFTEKFNAKVIRNVVTSPDGKSIAFNALGYIWTKKMPNGRPIRLTNGVDFEAEPYYSPNGSEILYVTWDDEKMGNINKIDLKTKEIVTLTTEKGIYRTPAFSNNGKKIVFQKEGGNEVQGRTFTKKTGIYIMETDGSKLKWLQVSGQFPKFNISDDRIYYQTGGRFFGALTKNLKSVNLNGKDERTHISSKYANRIVPSNDNKWVAFSQLHKVYIAPMPMTGKTVMLDAKAKNIPVAQVAKDAGVNLHWSSNSGSLHWTLGDQYFTNHLSDRFSFLKNAPKEIPPMLEEGIEINLEVKSDLPTGKIAFKGARIITMNGDEVIEDGTVLVEENKISWVGQTADFKENSNIKVYDVSGKTIMPGIVDVHAHVRGFRDGLNAKQHWPFYANLAFGVTTSHDPSANTEAIFTLSELIKSGEIVGPRLLSTGFILYGADGDFKAVVNNLEDARSAIRRTKAFGALSVKSYNQPRREQRQQILQAAREQGIFVVPEGGSTFFTNMTMIMDGHTGVEHNIPVAPVYKDVIELWSHSNTGYTPTLIVNYGGINGEIYWYQHHNVWENEKLLKYTPRGIIDARARHRTMVPEEEYKNGHILTAESCKILSDYGVKVNVGAHGQLQGLGAHWEMWMLEQGGMTAMETLRAATMNGAEYLGIGKDLGSIEVGKLADLIVLEKNPLENIQNTSTVQYTMVNGRLYDTETMNEIGNHPKNRGDFYWENNKYNGAFEWHEEAQSFTVPGCGCFIGHQ